MGKLSEAEFTTIKQLLAKGYDGKKVAEIVGRGAGTVSTVKNSASFDNYKNKMAKQTQPKVVKQEQLPLDKPKKTTLDLREDITIKFSGLMDSVEMYRKATPGINFKREIAVSRAKIHLEEAMLWLKDTF